MRGIPGRDPCFGHGRIEPVKGGINDRRLDGIAVVGPWFAVPDPRRAVLDRVVRDAQALVVDVENAPTAPA